MTNRTALLLLPLGAIFGSSFLFMRVAAPELGPIAVAEGRVGVAALALALAVGPRDLRVLATEWRGYLVLGLFNVAIPFALISFAEVTISASLAALLNATVPMFAVIVGAIWLRQRLTAKRLTAVVTGLVGVGVLVGWSPIELTPATILAAAAMLSATASYAIGLTYARRRFAGVPPVHSAAGQTMAATVILAPLALLTLPSAPPSLEAAVSVLTLGLLCTAFAWPLLFRLLGAFGPTAASTVTFLAPVFGVTWGALFLAEPLGPEMLVGGAVIAVSLLLIFDIRLPGRPQVTAARVARS